MEEKRYKVIITPFAEASLREIGQYISHGLLAPETAVKLLRKLQEEMTGLELMPGRVHLTPEEPWHSCGVRRLPVKNFYIYFWVDEGSLTVWVTDVTYARRDQAAVLGVMPLP